MAYNKKLMQKAYILDCINCGVFGTNFHHIKSRGAGGSDNQTNLLPLCALCHVNIHAIGLIDFSSNYKKNPFHYNIKVWLDNNGWELDGRKYIHKAETY